MGEIVPGIGRVRNFSRSSGFTLVELLVVVVIIVALAGIAVPIFLNQKDKADIAVIKSNLTSAGKMLVTASSTNGKVMLEGGGQSFYYIQPDGTETSVVASKGEFSLHNLLPDDKVATGSCVQMNYESFTFSYTVPTGLAEGACAS